MKKVLAMVLLCSTTALYAQNPTQYFEIFPGNIDRQFTFDLGLGQTMKLELMHLDDLQRLPNLDSLAAMVVRDIQQLTDTSKQYLHGRRLDYILMGNEKEMRLRSGTDRSEYFATLDSQVISLKMDEDTVMITGVAKAQKPYSFYRLSFYMNEFANLSLYHNGELQQKLQLLIRKKNEKWFRGEDRTYHLQDSTGITALAPQGKNQLTRLLFLVPSVDIQNYRDRFVPSITVGIGRSRLRNSIEQEYGLSSEAHFRFANVNGVDKIFLQSFITVSYGRGKVTSNMTSPVRLFPFIAVSYLVNARGDYYEKNTFRLGFGRFFLGNNSTKIEPSLYMNDLFKNISPSLRVVQVF